jgi:hypothetical protein
MATEAQLLASWRQDQVRELGRRLLYITGPEEVKVSRMPQWADDPGRLVSQLEASADGCRWLLERWVEFHNLLDYKVKWEETELLRFIRLQGKNVVESVYDPELNAIFLAWETLLPKFAKVEWDYFQEIKPPTDPAFNHRLIWSEIARLPDNPDAAWAVLSGIVHRHIDRLQKLLARNEALEAEVDPDWAPRAGLDSSPAFEWLRRAQSARHRELMRTLDALRKVREVESDHVVESESAVASGEWEVMSDEGVASDQISVASEEGGNIEVTAQAAGESEAACSNSAAIYPESEMSDPATEKAPNKANLGST